MDIGIILSLLAIAGTVFVYFMHDKRLKMQEKKLNDYQLEKIDAEKIENTKAQVRGHIIAKGNKGRRTLKVFNSGKARAQNIRIEWLSGMNKIYYREDSHFPYELLNPQDSTEIELYLVEGLDKTTKIKFMWDDEFANDNEFEQVLTL